MAEFDYYTGLISVGIVIILVVRALWRTIDKGGPPGGRR